MLDGQAAKGRERRPAARVEHCPAMAKRPSTPADLREAVERTVQATLGSAERQRERTQGALDDLAGTVEQVRKGAEAGIARGRKAVAGAIESGRPATYEDIRDAAGGAAPDLTPPRCDRGAAAREAPQLRRRGGQAPVLGVVLER